MPDISLLPEELKKREEDELRKRREQKQEIALHAPSDDVGKTDPVKPLKAKEKRGLFSGIFKRKKKPKPLIPKPKAAKPPKDLPTVPKVVPAPAVKAYTPPPAPPPPQPAPKARPIKRPPLASKLSTPTGSSGSVLRVSLIPEEGEGAAVATGKRGLWIIFVVFVISALLVLGGYLFAQSVAAGRADEISTINEQITQVNDQIKEVDANLKLVRETGRQLAAAEKLLDSHIGLTPFFEFLEKNTLPAVGFTQFTSDSPGTIILEGVGKTFKDASSQVSIFRNSPQVISSAAVRGMNADIAPNGELRGIKFSVIIELNPKILTAD